MSDEPEGITETGGSGALPAGDTVIVRVIGIALAMGRLLCKQTDTHA